MANQTSNYTCKVSFEADRQSVEKLRNELKSLQENVNQQLSSSNSNKLTKQTKEDLLDISRSLNSVRAAIRESFNEDLGTMNVTKFNQELKKIDIAKLNTQLSSFGAAGSAAFRDIAMQATSANLELKKTSKFMEKLGESMANTVRWNITSSIMNSFTGSIEKAYTYVKKLDTSLNNIRIVSGQSADQMAKFAVQANKAAQALGTTTTAYTDAALLYYQQGLSSQEVQKRTEITLKMANVLGETSSDVSSYMTAIWNNFADGTKTLEYFGDVITALGASTASSASEISEGLSQFAAVSNTVGLSYEYATSALATVVAATRQSADSVGTAFKTIFSRIQGLKLGETLDDGTSLNKYSNALKAVGVDIKDDNNQLKDMDTILDEMAGKWKVLNQDQKMALAQTVAGTRQYTYLLSLMDNWDSMTKNINTAADATGTLNEQQEIYNDSLRAHINELQSAKDALTTELFDSDSFKSIIDALTEITKKTSEFVKVIGGGGNALKALGLLATQIMSKQIAQLFTGMINNVKNTVYNINQVKSALENVRVIKDSMDKNEVNSSIYLTMREQNLKLINAMSESEREEADAIAKQTEALINERDILLEKENIIKETASQVLNQNFNDVDEAGKQIGGVDLDIYSNLKDELYEIDRLGIKVDSTLSNILSGKKKASGEGGYQAEIKGYKSSITTMMNDIKNENSSLTAFLTDEQKNRLLNAELTYNFEYSKYRATNEDKIKATKKFYDVYLSIAKECGADIESEEARVAQAQEFYDQIRIRSSQKVEEEIKEEITLYERLINTIKETVTAQGLINAASSFGSLINSIDMVKSSAKSVSDGESSAIGGLISSFTMAASSTLIVTKLIGPLIVKLLSLIPAFKGLAASALTASGALTGGATIAIAAVVVALGVLLPKLVKFIFREDEATKKTKALNNALEDTKSKAEELSGTFNNLVNDLTTFVDSVNKFNELKEGTQEWNEALVETNQQVLDLIDKYPKLKEALIVDGQKLGFDTEKATKVMEQYSKESLYAERAKYAADNAILNNQKESTKRYIYQDKPVEENQTPQKIQDFKEYAANKKYQKSYNKVEEYNELLYNAEKFNYEEKIDINEAAQNTMNAILDRAKNNDANDIVKIFGKEKIDNPEFTRIENEIKANNLLISKSILEEKGFGGIDNRILSNLQNKIANNLYNQKEYEITEDDKNKFANFMGGSFEESDGKVKIKDSLGNEIQEYTADGFSAAVKQYAIESSDEFTKFLNDELESTKKFLDGLENSGLSENSKDLAIQIKSGVSELSFGGMTDEEIKEIKDTQSAFYNTNDLTYQRYANVINPYQKQIDEALSEEGSKKRKDIRVSQYKAQYALALENDAEALGITSTTLEYYTDLVMENNDMMAEDTEQLEKNRVAAEKAAKANVVFAQSYEEFNKIFNDNYDSLVAWNEEVTKTGNFTSSELSYDMLEAVGEAKEALESLFGMDIDTKTFQKNFRYIEELFDGTTENLSDLRKNLAKSFNEGIKNELTDSVSNEFQNTLSTLFDDLNNFIDNTDFDSIKIGADLDAEDVIEGLNKLLESSQITEEQATEILNSIGYEPEFAATKVDIDTPEITLTGKTDLLGSNNEYKLTIDGTKSTFPVMGWGTKDNPPKARTIKGATATSTTSSMKSAVSGKGAKSSGKDKTKDNIKDTVDRYHDVNIELSKISTQLSVIQKQQEKLTGVKLIENLNKQMQLLDKQIEKTNKKISIAVNEASELKGKLSKKGVEFNGDEISNYASILQGKENALNDLINQYNKASDVAKEKLEKKIDEQQKDLDELKEEIERYDEVVFSMIPDLQADIEDAFDKEIEINVKKFDMSVEIELDLQAATKQWNSFKNRMIDGFKKDGVYSLLGDASEAYDNLKTYYGNPGSTGSVQELTKQVNDTLNEIAKMSSGQANVYGNNMQLALEDLKKYGTELQNALLEAEDIYDNIEDIQVSVLSEIANSANKINGIYESITKQLQHDTALVKLLKGENAYSSLLEFSKQQSANYANQVELLTSQTEYWRKKIDEAEPGSKAWEEARTNFEENADKLYSTIESAIENLRDQLSTTINQIFDELDRDLSGGYSLDYVNTEWDLINKSADRYLDTINAAYGIQKLESKVAKSISDSNSTYTKQQISKVMGEELNTLKSMDQLSQYDLDRANKKYELLLKEIALREAEQNKSKMRLRRDSSGNYSYQFVADDSKVSDLRQEVEDLNNEIYNLDKNQYKQNLNDFVTYYKEYQQEIADIENSAMSEEDKQKQRELVYEKYETILNGITYDNLKIRDNLQASFTSEIDRRNIMSLEAFKDLSSQEKDIIINQIVPQWTSGIQTMITSIAGEDGSGNGGFAAISQRVFTMIADAVKNYNDQLAILDSKSGGILTTLKNGYDNISKSLGSMIYYLNEELKYRDDEYNKINDIISILKDYKTANEDAQKAAVEAAEKAQKAWSDAQREQQKAAQGSATNLSAGGTNQVDTTITTNDSSVVKEDPDKGTPIPPPTSEEWTVIYPNGNKAVVNNEIEADRLVSAYCMNNKNARGKKDKSKRTIYISIITYTVTNYTPPDSYLVKSSTGESRSINAQNTKEALEKAEKQGFNTGGYTGEWGDEGKLAFLHEKELVLNKEDTKNILDTVNIVRAINNNLSSSLRSMVGEISGIKYNPVTNTNTDNSIEQTVYITANFEGETTADEIKNALGNLMNVASLKVNTKK